MELLSPAGNFEKLKTAITYGADAVYFGGEAFGLRANAGNFTLPEIKEAMKYLHNEGKKGYLTVNAYAQDEELTALEEYLCKASEYVDAFIISDPGVFAVAKQAAPGMELHISTQANTTNSAAINFWAAQGAKRVIMARELSKDQLENVICKSTVDIEVFAHGAICISYSGRCVMSAYMTGRDANRGECTQPCRWNYTVKESTRPDQNFEAVEDERGTYLYNAKDLCLIDRIGELYSMGVSSLKIEGRMKSVMYVAVVTAAYRKAIDEAMKNPESYKAPDHARELLESVSNRNYTEGFYAGVPDKDSMNYDTSAYVRNADFLGVISKANKNEGSFTLECRAKFSPGDILEILTPSLKRVDFRVKQIKHKENDVENTKPNGEYTVHGNFNIDIQDGSLLRRNLLIK